MARSVVADMLSGWRRHVRMSRVLGGHRTVGLMGRCRSLVVLVSVHVSRCHDGDARSGVIRIGYCKGQLSCVRVVRGGMGCALIVILVCVVSVSDSGMSRMGTGRVSRLLRGDVFVVAANGHEMRVQVVLAQCFRVELDTYRPVQRL